MSSQQGGTAVAGRTSGGIGFAGVSRLSSVVRKPAVLMGMVALAVANVVDRSSRR